jgi:HD domain
MQAMNPGGGDRAALPAVDAAARARSEWIGGSPVLARAYSLAETAHRSQTRATDGRPFLDHVTEVAGLLEREGFDEDLVAAGLLHDSVERGTLTEEALRSHMSPAVCELVLALTEDSTIASFSERKAALRDQVGAAGDRALTIFAADKLSDVLGLRRGIQTFGGAVEERMGASIRSMAGHYRESVELIEAGRPGSTFLPELHAQLDCLEAEIPPAVGARSARP